MDPTTLETTAVGTSIDASAFSFWGLFFHADWVVQIVMVLLLGASFWCWTIIFAKLIRFKTLRHRAEKFEESFWSGKPLDQLFERIGSHPQHPLAAVFSAAMGEWHRAIRKRRPGNQDMRTTVQQRIERVMQVTATKEMEDLESHLSFLASVGSTAPFIGLFGTVWGIMNSFQGIAASQSTNLAVVAPGIAEALFATALGLVAAIPAVIAYNKISTDLDRYASRLETFSSEFAAIISRQLEETEATGT